MRVATIPETTRTVDLTRYREQYDKVYYRSRRGRLQCVLFKQGSRVNSVTAIRKIS